MIIDTRGRACPEPLVMTRRAISEAPAGSAFEVLCDNDTACTNLLSYLKTLGIDAVRTVSGDTLHIAFTLGEASSHPTEQPVALPACACGPEGISGDYAMVIRSQVMGSGDDELGALLMRSCINSIRDLDALPSVVVLYNGGVMLAVEGTDTASSLTALRAAGVRIVVCGTCVDFFGIKARLAVGEISNMLSINNLLATTGHIIYP